MTTRSAGEPRRPGYGPAAFEAGPESLPGDRRVKILEGVREVPRGAWDTLGSEDPAATPFTSWAFLSAVEGSGCASPDQGWWPRHLTLWRGGRLVAAAPAYIRGNGFGDFSHDWGFADFAGRIGVRFYPKLVLAAPFTPVGGRRILVAPGEDRAGCVAEIGAAAMGIVREFDLSGVQVLFSTPDEAEELGRAGFAPWVIFQYYWVNRGYATWDEWLGGLTSKRRAMVRRERRAPGEQGISIRTVSGDELRETPAEWARQISTFYRATYDKYLWNRPFLTERFFRAAIEEMPGSLQVVEARRGGRLIAGAFNLRSDSRLFGRYWGAFEEHPFLHFNVCFYHSIEECIRDGVQVFEGGMGGEHKLLRGFEPVLVHSAHAYADPRLDGPIRAYLTREVRARKQELRLWSSRGKG